MSKRKRSAPGRRWKKTRKISFSTLAVLLSLAVLLALFLFALVPVRVEQSAAEAARSKSTTSFNFTSNDEKELDFVLLLDVSGSMDDQKDIRDEAARTFIESLPDNAQAAICFFDSEVIADLSQASLLPIWSNRDDLLNALDKSRDYDYSYDSNGVWRDRNTHTGSAVSAAVRTLNNGRTNAEKIIVLFTDGEPKASYNGKVDVQETQRLWNEFVSYTAAAHAQGMEVYIVHSPSGDGSTGREENQAEVDTLCASLCTEAITVTSAGVTVFLTEWGDGELAKVIAIDDIYDLSQAFLTVLYSLKEYRVQGFSVSASGQACTFYLPTGIGSIDLYMETRDASRSGSADTFGITSVTAQETGMTFLLDEPSRVTTHGKYYHIDNPGSGTFLVSQETDTLANITVMERFDFDVTVNVDSTFSPLSKETLRIEVAGTEEPVGLEVWLSKVVYNSEGEAVDSGKVENGAALNSLVMLDAGSGGTILLRPHVKYSGGELVCNSDDLRATLGDNAPVMVGVTSRSVLKWPFRSTISLGAVDILAYDTEDEVSSLAFQTDSTQFALSVEDGILYASYSNPLFLAAGFTVRAVDSSKQESEAVNVNIYGFPLGVVIFLVAAAIVVAFAVKSGRQKKQERNHERKLRCERREQEKTTPWHGGITWSEQKGGDTAIGALADLELVNGRFVRRCGIVELNSAKVFRAMTDSPKRSTEDEFNAENGVSYLRELSGVTVRAAEFDMGKSGLELELRLRSSGNPQVEHSGGKQEVYEVCLPEDAGFKLYRFRVEGNDTMVVTLKVNGVTCTYTVSHVELPANVMTFAEL